MKILAPLNEPVYSTEMILLVSEFLVNEMVYTFSFTSLETFRYIKNTFNRLGQRIVLPSVIIMI